MTDNVSLTFNRDYARLLLAKLSASKGLATDITETKSPVHGPGDMIHCFNMLFDAVQAIEPHLREAVLSVGQVKRDVLPKAYDELKRENDALKAALWNARRAAAVNGVIMRDFAEECGISPTQLSEWTSEKLTTKPDFVD